MSGMGAPTRVNARAKRAFTFMLDLLYPPRCAGCGEFGAGAWCAACSAKTTWFDARSRVKAFALESESALYVLSAGLFAEPLRDAIHAFKYDDQPQLAQVFAEYMIEVWLASGFVADVLAPVPLHPTRQRERGFNQSELLARHISRALGIPEHARALARTRRTKQQAQLSADAHEARQQNVRGAFTAAPQLVNGKQIVLIDDVLTTGATLCECANALYRAGALHVTALTLARAHL